MNNNNKYNTAHHVQVQWPEPTEQKRESVSFSKNLNGWYLNMSTDEDGKISMYASKTIGTLRGKYGDDAEVRFSVDTTSNRVPEFKIVGSGYSRSSASGVHYYSGPMEFVELNDGLDRTAKEYDKNKYYYKRAFIKGSIITTQQFFNEVFGEFEELLQDKTIDQYVSKISDSAARVQEPHNRDYHKK